MKKFEEIEIEVIVIEEEDIISTSGLMGSQYGYDDETDLFDFGWRY